MPDMPSQPPSSLGPLDWAVLAGYFVLLVTTGWVFSRREQRDTEDYFLGGRRMPTWAVSISIVATSLSVASFIGVPQQAYTSDLTYLSTNIGMILAALVVAFVFMPAFYRRRVRTIYELLDQRYGRAAMQATSGSYMVGRVMASGVRIYIGAIPVSIMLFGNLGMEPESLSISIAVLTLVSIFYTLVGGVSGVIWTDVIQTAVLLGACLLAVILIIIRLPIGPAEALSLLGDAEGINKLALIDLGSGPEPWWTHPFSLPAVIVGFTLMGIASYGTDQDMTQRMLTCRDEKAAARSVMGGILAGIPAVALFMCMGLLLWLFYQQPDIWTARGLPIPAEPADSRTVFLGFIINEMPAGLGGLMMAGLFAAGLANSGINAMSSTFVNDFYRRWRPARTEQHYVSIGRAAVVAWGLILGGFAIACVFWQKTRSEDDTLLTFALGVMTFAYAGLVPVFLTALLTRRGSTAGVIITLVTGFSLVLAMQPIVWRGVADLDSLRLTFANARAIDPNAARPPLLAVLDLAFVWKLTIAASVAMLVSLSFPLPRAARRASRPGAPARIDPS